MMPYYEQDGITIFHGDCRDILPELDAASVDLLATDPPYFRVKDESWDRQWKSPEAFADWIGSLCDEWRRVLKPNGSAFVFASPDMTWVVEGEIRQRFRVLNTIRWVKEAGWHNKADKESLRSFLSPWESIIFAEQFADQYADAERALHKDVYAPVGRFMQQRRLAAGLMRGDVDAACSPSRKPTGLCYRWEEGACLPTVEQFVGFLRLCGDDRIEEALRQDYEALRRPFEAEQSRWSDIWSFQTVAPYPGKHPCEKPVPLMENVISVASRDDAVVLDCFAGTGATLTAARNLGRRAIGIEIEERYCEIAAKRLQQSVMVLA